MSESAEKGGHLAKSATLACACVSAAVLTFVSFDLLTQHESKESVALAREGSVHHLASLHPPLLRTPRPNAQSSAQSLRASMPSQGVETSPHTGRGTSQAKSIELAAIRGPSFDSVDDVVEPPVAKLLPWGVHLTAGWSREKALDQYKRLQKRYSDALSGKEPKVIRVTNHGMGTAERYMVHIAQPDRAEAEKLCARITEAGGACAVYKNWRR